MRIITILDVYRTCFRFLGARRESRMYSFAVLECLDVLGDNSPVLNGVENRSRKRMVTTLSSSQAQGGAVLPISAQEQNVLGKINDFFVGRYLVQFVVLVLRLSDKDKAPYFCPARYYYFLIHESLS